MIWLSPNLRIQLIEFTLTSIGAHRVRFAVSPLDEVLATVRIAIGLRGYPVQTDWFDLRKAQSLPIAELRTVLRDPGYICEFLSPPPTEPDTTAAVQLAEIRRTPPAQVQAELRTLNLDLHALPTRPEQARDLLADQIEHAWTELIEPHWPRLKDILLTDIGYRAAKLASGGVSAVIADLHPDVRMAHRAETDVILVRNTARVTFPLDKRGLLLIPSVFTRDRIGVIAVEPWQPSIIYPARGIAEAHQQRTKRAGLARVLGRTRATLLAALEEPMSTATLARSLELSSGTVSEHLGAMRDAGLLTTARRGHTVLYRRTTLGDDLLHG